MSSQSATWEQDLLMEETSNSQEQPSNQKEAVTPSLTKLEEELMNTLKSC